MSEPVPHLELLQQWMEEYLLDREFGPDALDIRMNERVKLDAEVSDPLASGQIRLWPDAGEGGPFYGLIWGEGYDLWWVFPFSPYATPATPEELTVRDAPPVRVVQGWNPRKVPGKAIRGTWCVDLLAPDRMKRVELWWTQVQAQTLSFHGVENWVGPPLLHPMDPRFDYLEQERNRADLFLGEAPALYEAERPGLAAERPEEQDDYGD